MSKKEKAEPLNVSQTLGQLERLARLVRAAGQEGNLSPAQWDALRFVSRANRFSNSPIALSQYVGATKGTTSQTIAQLAEKGFLLKADRQKDGRSVALLLSEKGASQLKTDPLQSLHKVIGKMSSKTQRRFAKGLTELLQVEHRRQKQPSFGSCGDCRYYREAPDHCMKFAENLYNEDLTRICVAHVKR
jgi:DNA-binding MarR family transcriptional regulator